MEIIDIEGLWVEYACFSHRAWEPERYKPLETLIKDTEIMRCP